MVLKQRALAFHTPYSIERDESLNIKILPRDGMREGSFMQGRLVYNADGKRPATPKRDGRASICILQFKESPLVTEDVLEQQPIQQKWKKQCQPRLYPAFVPIASDTQSI